MNQPPDANPRQAEPRLPRYNFAHAKTKVAGPFGSYNTQNFYQYGSMPAPPQVVPSLPTAPGPSRAPGQSHDQVGVASSSEPFPRRTNSQLDMAIKLSQRTHKFLWTPHFDLSDGLLGVEEAWLARVLISRLKKIEKTLWGDPDLSELLLTVTKYKERGNFAVTYPDQNGETLYQANHEYEMILEDFNQLGTCKGHKKILVDLRVRHSRIEKKVTKASRSFKNTQISTMRHSFLSQFRQVSPSSQCGESQGTGSSPPHSDSDFARDSSSSTSNTSSTPWSSSTDEAFFDGSQLSTSRPSEPSTSTSNAPSHSEYTPLASQYDGATLNGGEGLYPDESSSSGPASSQEETHANDTAGTEYWTPRSFFSLELPVTLPSEDVDTDSESDTRQINDGHAYAALHPQETSLELTQNGESASSSEAAGGKTSTYVQNWVAGVSRRDAGQ